MAVLVDHRPAAPRQLRRAHKRRRALPPRFASLAKHASELPPAPAPGTGLSIAAFAAGSALLHALSFAAAVLAGRMADTNSPAPEEPVSMKIIEVAAPPLPPVEEITEPAPEAAKPPPIARRTPPPPPTKSEPEEPVPDPSPHEFASPTPARRIVGLSLSSTVQGGHGPAFAVGNTLAGSTASRAAAPSSIAALAPGSTDPVRLSMPQPEYPRRLKLQEIEGRVRLSAVIGVDGRASQVALVQSSGHDEFDHAAIAAAERGQYQPAMRGGAPVPARITFSVEFRLR
ncbi:MAG: TonB family protein [Polyangiales bacterium]